MVKCLKILLFWEMVIELGLLIPENTQGHSNSIYICRKIVVVLQLQLQINLLLTFLDLLWLNVLELQVQG